MGFKPIVGTIILVTLILALTPRIPLVSAEFLFPICSRFLAVDWSHYHNYTEIVDILFDLNASYPSLVDLFSIGKSWQNREIYCVRLTNENLTREKPKVLFVGYHHARELISAELPLYFVVNATQSFGINPTVTRMLNYSEIYVIVALNVDAFDVVEENEWQRKNVHPFDEEDDGLFDEDPPEDEDGDGYVEGLWQWNGSAWVFIRWEGPDNDGDGKYGEDWVGGVDLNRNYGYAWNASVDSGSPHPRDQDYRGPSPFSEPETRALRDLALQHNFKYAISFHSGAEVILYPWGYTHNPTPHDYIFRQIAANLSELTGFPYQQGAQLYTTSGVWDDWMYGNRSTFAFTCEIYRNNDAWRYEPGPLPNSWWEGGVFEFFNPDPSQIETVVLRWMPVFIYIAERAIIEAYDVAVAEVIPYKTLVGEGYPLFINVTVENQGFFTETFNVTLFSNTTAIGTETVTVPSGNFTRITFTMNTAGLVKYENYTLSATVDFVFGEIDTADNSFVDGKIQVVISGDVNGDGTVNMKDIYACLILHFGCEQGQPCYVPNYDIDGDGKINMKDIFTSILHYGESYP